MSSNRPLIGIPYAMAVWLDDGRAGVVCPECYLVVITRERKDHESYTGREYAEHYEAEHKGVEL